MKVTVILEIGSRTVVESVVVPTEARKDWRSTIGEMACRMELATYGPPSTVEEMTAEDQPTVFRSHG